MKPVWVADDDQSIRWVLEKALARVSIPCRCFASGDEVLEALESETPSVLVTDIRMPGGDGLALLGRVKALHPTLAVIVMTAYTDLDSTVAAFQRGAFEYLVKPFDLNMAVSLIQRALRENESLGDSIPAEVSGADGVADRLLESGGKAEALDANGRRQAGSEPTGFGAVRSLAVEAPESGGSRGGGGARVMMQSSSPAMQDVFRAIGRLAASPASVLITGESGTGKELIARALHEHGVRAKGPFIAVNAAAIPRDLLEAELFGHERGAFTGATQLRRGRFEAAHGGTLFLDEIGDMSLELQTRLLRVLAQGSFYRVGGSQAIDVDVRIVAATHQPLERLVAEHAFREDLFHRLNVIRLRLPPLRERRDDIPALAGLFLKNSAEELRVPVRRLSPAARQVLCDFDYPGNIRQLENFCHWVTVMSAGQLVDAKDLPPELSHPVPAESRVAAAVSVGSQPPPPAEMTWLELLAAEVTARLSRGEPALMSSLTRDFERVILEAALRHSQGRRAEAAQRLGIGRNTLTRKHKELGMDDGSEETGSA
ncbi:MAG TPA: sigma 54-interacting transcriptional regulator [Burkholderiaceae bacterium]|nr:sigma 54-interacting transcriptional regulator [Burkholderiaceae bacterium]